MRARIASTTQPVMSPVPRLGKYWELVAPLEVLLPEAAEGPSAVRVRPGFRTDGASIPRYLWWLIGHPMHAPFVRGAVVHDFYYRTATIERAVADAILRAMLIEDGVSAIRAGVMYYAVRAFGGLHWRKQRKGAA